MLNLADIAPAFAFVGQRGLVQGATEYSPQEFGNASLVMVGAPLSLRFVRDRGQVFVSVGSNSVGWHALEYALAFVDPSITQEQLGEPPDAAMLAGLLESRWADIVRLFSNANRISQLQHFANQKSTALTRRLFPNP